MEEALNPGVNIGIWILESGLRAVDYRRLLETSCMCVLVAAAKLFFILET